uniref:Uncharacterized protein n=1 Tax=Sphaerodactylus townsendi TaxID=933632 RepID=A0ACB8E640_9SAUR
MVLFHLGHRWLSGLEEGFEEEHLCPHASVCPGILGKLEFVKTARCVPQELGLPVASLDVQESRQGGKRRKHPSKSRSERFKRTERFKNLGGSKMPPPMKRREEEVWIYIPPFSPVWRLKRAYKLLFIPPSKQTPC